MPTKIVTNDADGKKIVVKLMNIKKRFKKRIVEEINEWEKFFSLAC